LRKRINAGRPPARAQIVAVLLILGWVINPASAQQPRGPGREPVSTTSAPVSDVRDGAGLFSPNAVNKAKEKLVHLERETRLPVVIETIDRLQDGESIAELAREHAHSVVGVGLFILIAKHERKTEVYPTREYQAIFPEPLQHAILDAFNREFARDRLDEGLGHGIETIATALTGARNEGKLPLTPASETAELPTSPDLIVRNQVRLSLAGTRRIIAGAEAKASAMGLKMNIAVVDEGGHLLAFERMDGARPASVYTAMTKATTAATMRQPTGPIKAPGADVPDPLLNLSLQNAAAASGGKVTTLLGGLPIVVNGQVIGGIGVGGGTGEQDATVARAGIDQFLGDLQPKP
jgi:glc operon protein GlcG